MCEVFLARIPLKRQACYARLTKMIRAEGFQMADFTAHENDRYYLRDPWHLAWTGWVDVDKAPTVSASSVVKMPKPV